MTVGARAKGSGLIEVEVVELGVSDREEVTLGRNETVRADVYSREGRVLGSSLERFRVGFAFM